jgi:hypothetical protein
MSQRPAQFTIRTLFTTMIAVSAALGLVNQVGIVLAFCLGFLGWLMLMVFSSILSHLFDFQTEQADRELRRQIREFERENRTQPPRTF